MSNYQNEEDHKRSLFIKGLIQRTPARFDSVSNEKIPKRIIQFWDNLEQLPSDVYDCIKSWYQLEILGYEILLFDSKKAGDFINEKLGSRFKKAYDKCYHPAMQSDYFRLCYIFVEGGCYIDADDVYSGEDINHLFNDNRLKIQPLCYDVSSHSMISPTVFAKAGAYADSWIFYFNNNPIIARCKDLIIEKALYKATSLLEADQKDNLPEIQSTTGPGNLSKSVMDVLKKTKETEQLIFVLNHWENIAESKWPLSYRHDARNWRLSNCQSFKNPN